MIEIRIHGRGGQGAVVASKVLAVAMFAEGKYVQAFPRFGVERRGAPVEAFLRLEEGKILIRSEITHPDHVVVLDATLIEAVDVTAGLAKGGWAIVNTDKQVGDFQGLDEYRVACVNASRIAVDHGLGSRSSPIVNTAICGAFAKCTGLVGIESVCEAIKEEVPIKAEENAQAARDAFDSTEIRRSDAYVR
ncbi:MAG: pyruvate ferredoxin oxidoreductase [Proteobacteria bacterium]|nr:pyruvate ferredoxin oxidoreductase [Pseudomonadota bacterium]